MFAGHRLLQRQFPEIQGLQDTIFSQQIENFISVNRSAVAVQILFSGDGHWVCTSFSDTTGVCIYDSFPEEKIASDLKVQIGKIYGQVDLENDGILISRIGVQRQTSLTACGVFALAMWLKEIMWKV